jgi:transcriptional regulator with GAF, ATPase, and Fis domain
MATPEHALGRRVDEEAALRAVVEGTATETGRDFYRALVRNLAAVLDVHGAWVTEYDPEKERLRALAFWFGHDWVEGFEYAIAGTACEKAVREGRLVHIPDRVVEMESVTPPENFQRAGVVSYLGMPLLERERVLGHVAVVDVRPLPADPRILTLFQLFANRARSEMRRLRLEAELRDSREELAGLVDGAMDAIVELDAALRVTRMNPAAEKLFACGAGAIGGARVDRLVGAAACAKLRAVAEELERRTGDRNLWIPALVAEPPGCAPFPAEATFSRFEVRGQPSYTLILRNVGERVAAARTIRQLTAQAEYLREELAAGHGFGEIVGGSAALRAALQGVAQVAATDATVLVLGETGTGKELFARAIHERSARRDGPLVKVNCAAIPAALVESELFGHEKGAFTGATQRREGRFALADRGTIFLDEIGELPLELQGKLLRVLQEGEFEPVGATRTRKVDVRVVAATNRDLERAVREGTFREDLYYRLSVFPLRLPALRERGDDVVLLAAAMVEKLARAMGKVVAPLGEADAAALKAYPWPGNVRELRNVLERAIITATDGRLDLERALPASGTARRADAPPEAGRILNDRQLRDLERDNMIAALERAGWRVAGEDGAAGLLGVSPSTLKSRMKALDVRRPDAR